MLRWLWVAVFISLCYWTSKSKALEGSAMRICVEELKRKDIDDHKLKPIKIESIEDARQCIVACLKKSDSNAECKAVVYRAYDAIIEPKRVCKLYDQTAMISIDDEGKKNLSIALNNSPIIDANDSAVTYYEILRRCPSSAENEKKNSGNIIKPLGSSTKPNNFKTNEMNELPVLSQQRQQLIGAVTVTGPDFVQAQQLPVENVGGGGVGAGYGVQTPPTFTLTYPPPPIVTTTPVGQWTEWNQWAACSCQYTGGTQTRYRTCSSFCAGGLATETRGCQCQQEPQWSAWSAWSACPTTCGPGTVSRTRQCSLPNSCIGAYNEQMPCSNAFCPTYGQWQPWGACSVTCGQGEQTRNRVCSDGGNNYGLPAAPNSSGPEIVIVGTGCTGPATEKQPCSTNAVCCDEWTLWSRCSATCGIGSQTRTRTCGGSTGYPGATTGQIGVGETKTDQQPCNAGPCPTWGTWTPFGPCSTTCGPGQRTRSRQCQDGVNCQGEANENMACDAGPCPYWSEWTPWTACGVTCGTGYQASSRQCQYGTACLGDNRRSQHCDTGPCYAWCQWQDWSLCNVGCGPGQRNRRRVCAILGSCNAAYQQQSGGLGDSTGGGYARCIGDDKNEETCNQGPCAVWSVWTPWTACSATCGPGAQTRVRTCTGGLCTGESRENKPCTACSCPSWMEWGSWSDCSVYCGQGVASRSRQCANGCNNGGAGGGGYGGQQQAHGHGCPGEPSQTQPCTKQCAQWTPWSDWSPCTATCNGGLQTRTRICSGGTDCRGEPNQEQPCQTIQCVYPTPAPVTPPPYQPQPQQQQYYPPLQPSYYGNGLKKT